MPAITDFDVDLATIYTVTYADYATRISDRYANRGAAAAFLIGFDAYWTFMAISDADFTDANFQAVAWIAAANNDALITTDGYINQGAYPDDGIASRANILLPHGGYKTNFPLFTAHGRTIGKGSANYTSSQTQVHSAGTGAVNGYYNRSGSFGGRPRYALDGASTDDEITWDGGNWVIYSGGVSQYEGTEDVSYPHKVTTWTATGGAGPAPTVQRPSASGTTPGTNIIIDHDYWLTSCMAERNCIQSSQWGNISLNGYMEGEQVEQVRCSGAVDEVAAWIADPGHYDPAYSSSGIAMWSAGSVSRISNCHCSDFNDFGALLGDKPTPATLDTNSFFRNQRAAVGVIGGGTVFAYSTECDGSPAVFYVREGYTQSPAIAKIYAWGIKVEDGPAPQIPYPKGCCIADIEAWTCMTVVGASMASTFSVPDILFRIKNTANSSSLNVSGLQIFDKYRTLLHDVTNDKKWLVDGPEYSAKWTSAIHEFTWVSNDGGVLFTNFRVPRQVVATYEGRLQWLAVDGSGNPLGTFNDVAGTPPYIP